MHSKAVTGVAVVAVSLFALTGVAHASVFGGNTGWRWSNPLPQGNSLLVSDSAGARVFGGGEEGTLLRSDDSGRTWTSKRTGLLADVRRMRAISRDSVVFSTQCALRRSDDGGNTVRRLPWAPNEERCPTRIQSFSFPGGSTGFLLLENGEVFVTTDDGASWDRRTAVPGTQAVGGGQEVKDIWFNGPSTGVASAGGSIYRTVDGGNSWFAVFTSPALGSVIAFEFLDATNGFAVGGNNLFLKTADGGATWTDPSLGAGSPVPDSHSLSCADLLRCLITTNDGRLIRRTIDGGATWQAVSPSTAEINSASFITGTQAVAVGSQGETVRTDDAGATWSRVSGGVGGRFTRLRASSATSAVIAGERGILALTQNGGKSWRTASAPTDADVVDASFTGPVRGYVLDSRGAVLRTDNLGASWLFLNAGSSAKSRAVHAPNATTVLLVGPRGVRRSTNAGGRFSTVGGRRLSRMSLKSIDAAGRTVFAYGARNIVVSKNRGKSWKRVKKPRAARAIRTLDMVSSRAGYLLDTRSEVYYTKNGGKRWRRIETTGGGRLYSLAFADRRNGYLASDDGKVSATYDGGSTWNSQFPFYGGSEESGISSMIAAPSKSSAFMLVRGSNHVFVTNTGGKFGARSTLKIKASKRRVRRRARVRITGKLSPAAGGERVTVLSRRIGAKAGTKWRAQVRTVSSAGTFTTSWRLSRSTIFVARWSGNAARDGDAAKAVKVRVRR